MDEHPKLLKPACKFFWNGRWICPLCRLPARSVDPTRPPRRACRKFLPLERQTPCPLGDVVLQLSAGGIDRLQLCRRARCGLLIAEKGLCAGMPGGRCQKRARWIRCLNGNEAFSDGADVCPYW